MSPFAAAGGVIVDSIVGEPPVRWHPVAHYGSLMQSVEQHIYADRRVNGVLHTAVGVGFATLAGLALRRAVGPLASTVVATAICAAGTMLDDESIAIARLLELDDLPAARVRLRSLVGRRPDDLDEGEISRAVVESLAENGVDAVTSTLWWAAIGGAPAAFAHRASNTLDAMVGHRTLRYERFGWASARLDDALNFIPARLTAVATAVVRPNRAGEILRIVRRDAPGHPSPNGGVIESAFAAALGVRLGGVNQYGDEAEDRGFLGDGSPTTAATIREAVRLRRQATVAVAGLMIIGSSLARTVVGRPRGVA